MADERCAYETVRDKAVEGLLASHGYGNATLTPQDDGSVTVFAEKRALTWNGRWRLTAKVSSYGEVTDVEERDW